MAGMQSCCRSLLIFNISRLVNRNGNLTSPCITPYTLLQPNRRKYHLLFHAYSSENKLDFQKSAVMCYTGRLLAFRLASTSVTQLNNADSAIPKPETPPNRNESVQLNNEVPITESTEVIDESTLPPAPEPSLTELPDVEFISMGLKEPSFESLGLGSWYPSGIIQQILEFFHINLGLPWWEAIILGTLLCRLLLFPVYINSRKAQIHLFNHIPQITKFQEKINNARLSGDQYAVLQASHELNEFMKEKKLNFFSMFQSTLFQAPVFLSMFYGLKTMANLPVESLKTEGLFWFSDLTVPDPYYILPLILSTTLFAVIELGAEGGPMHKKSQITKWFLRGIPVAVFIFSLNFPSCITLYWTTSNFTVLSQVGLFKIPLIAKALNLPKALAFDSSLYTSKKGFLEEFKEGFSSAKLTSQLKERERINLISFKRAGNGPIPRTFKNNPVFQKEK